jgi:hypothetical protein
MVVVRRLRLAPLRTKLRLSPLPVALAAVQVYRALVRRLPQALVRRIRKALALQVRRLHPILEVLRLQLLPHPPLALDLPARPQRLLHLHHNHHSSLGRIQRQLLRPLHSLDRPTQRPILLAPHRMPEVAAAFRSVRHQLLRRVDKLPVALGLLQRPRSAPLLPLQVQDIHPMVLHRVLQHSPLAVVVSGALQRRLQHPSATLGKHREEVLVHPHRSSNKDSGRHRQRLLQMVVAFKWERRPANREVDGVLFGRVDRVDDKHSAPATECTHSTSLII